MFSGPGIIGVNFDSGPVSLEVAVWICHYRGRKKIATCELKFWMFLLMWGIVLVIP